jgi:hypothetical protein
MPRGRPVHRLLAACGASLVLYFVAFAFLLDRPLTLGALRARIEANLARGETIHEPKLVILAGSNGPYSHRCATIEPILGRPCVNAGVAVGIGLDYLFTRWKPLLNPGDMVYLPLEEAQYTRRRSTAGLGPDAAIMLRHDRATLWTLPLSRQIAALFASDLRAAIMSLIETALFDYAFDDPREAATGSTNAWGDHVGHTAALAALNQSGLAKATQFHPSGTQIEAGYGTAVVVDFLRWANQHGVRAIGGLPTGFADLPICDASLAAIRAIYRDHAAEFVELSNLSRYPRASFFDTPDHLNEPAQISHSVAIAERLLRLTARVTDRTPAPSP